MKKNIKNYKELLIVAVIVTFIIIFQVINVMNDKQNTNRENDTVNLNISEVYEITEEEIIYSMQKGEKFAKLGEVIIYVNDFDECIYMFNIKDKSYKKLYHSEYGISKIYFDGEYVYLLPSYYRGKGIVKIDLLGNEYKIYEGASIQLWLEEDKMYFVDQIGYDQINGTPQGNLCTMNKDGSNKQIIIQDVKNYFYIVNNYIYYTDQNSRSAYRANLDGTNKKEIAKGRTYITSATDKYLTYIDYSDGEKHRIVYLDNEQNNEVGRFGSIFSSKNGLYFYTRKLIDSNNNIENNFTLFNVDITNHSENAYWTSPRVSLDHLSYVYNGYCYFRSGSEYYRVNEKNCNEQEKMNFGHSFFIDGKVYGIKSKDGVITELYIYDLDNMSKETIKVN